MPEPRTDWLACRVLASSYVSALTLDGRGVSGGVTLQASSESLHFFFSYVDLTAYDITFQG